jgi:hypothetical protein
MIRENKKFTVILVVALTVVWGGVIYRVVDAVWGAAEEDTAAISGQSMRVAGEESFRYDGDARDPFAFHPVIRRDTLKARSKTILPEPTPWTPPPFKLIGIIIDKSKRTAILEDATGETFYLSQKDTLAGVTILQIEPHLVRYSFKKENRDWILD